MWISNHQEPRFPSQMLGLAIALLLSVGTAFAEDTWKVDAKKVSDVVTMKDFPNIIQISVKKNDQPADKAKVVVTRLRGDALLYDAAASPRVQGDSVTVTTNSTGSANASILMQQQGAAMFNVSVVDAANKTLAGPASIDFNALDDIPTGELLKCSRNETDDCRGRTQLSFYTGYAINTFAAPALGGVTTPAADQAVQERDATAQAVIAGVDFSHRIYSRRPKDSDDPKAPPPPPASTKDRWLGELWVYGETLHGLQSTNNCSGSGENETDAQQCTATANGETFEGIIKGASTLEAYAGIRWEPQFDWVDLQGARLYGKGQLGFISLVGHGADLIDNHHAGVGVIKVNGPFTDSYFEVGYGRNDLFAKRNKGRWKFDGLISYNMKWKHAAMIRPFLQLVADSDFGRGGDSVQTFMGLDFDLTMLKVFSVPGRE
jgi:hypothetical protein